MVGDGSVVGAGRGATGGPCVGGGHRAAGRSALAAVALASAVGAAWPTPALAHGIVGVSRDRPIPDWLLAWAAAVVLVASFVGLSAAWRRPRLQDDRWRPLRAGRSSPAVPGGVDPGDVAPRGAPADGRVATGDAQTTPADGRAVLADRRGPGVGPPTVLLAGRTLGALVGVATLALVLWAGWTGTPDVTRNVAPTIVFVTVWVGLPILSAVLGDVARPLNPWAAIGRTTGAAVRVLRRGRPVPHLPYPERLGHWPAVAGLLAFVWLELLYAVPGGPRLEADTVATATAVYTAWTLAAMGLFGVEPWRRHGETFAVLLALFARLAPLERRDGRLGRRGALRGVVAWPGDAPRGAVALVLVLIGTTAFDGAQEGVLHAPGTWLFEWFLDRGLGITGALRASSVVLMAGCVLLVAAVYRLAMAGARRAAGRERSTGELGAAFVHSFVPIALAYLVAHYVSLLLFQGQAQLALLSDPRGDDSDWFGTASWGVDYGLIDAEGVWYLQVGALVTGHVVALLLAHDRALALFGDHRTAARSQRWMLALMVAFTVGGLWLISSANG